MMQKHRKKYDEGLFNPQTMFREIFENQISIPSEIILIIVQRVCVIFSHFMRIASINVMLESHHLNSSWGASK